MYCGLWYDGRRPNSLAFSVDRNVVIQGVRLFGRKGATYGVTIGIYSKGSRSVEDKLTEEVGKFDTDKEKISGYYEFDVLFKKPVPVKKNETYEIRAVLSGLPSYYGKQGQAQVADNGICVSFSVAVSRESYTNADEGQFPEFIFF